MRSHGSLSQSRRMEVAGNIVAPSPVPRVQFAAERVGTPLVVVMGRSQCGAGPATLEALGRPATWSSPSLGAIVERFRPAVEGLLEAGHGYPGDALCQQAVSANARVSANHLRRGSAVPAQLLQSDGLRVVGAEYSLETGVVDFFDGVPKRA